MFVNLISKQKKSQYFLANYLQSDASHHGNSSKVSCKFLHVLYKLNLSRLNLIT